MLAVMLEQAAFSRFTHRAAASLRACGFAPPAPGQARVVVFDSAPWWSLRDDASCLLSCHEATRASRFRHALDHDTYTIAHAFWRVALGIVLGADPARVNLTRSPGGQPLLPRSGIATSLSHSGTMVAIAIGRGSAIGVDIEGFTPRTHLNDIVDVLCTPEEAGALSTLDGDARTRALLDLWTRKEALLKAFGVGLRVPPSSIRVDTDDAIAPPDEVAQATPCRLHALAMPVGWAGSVALSADIASHTLHHV